MISDHAAQEPADALLSLSLRLAWLMGGLLTSGPEPSLTLRTLRILYRLRQGPRRAGELASSAGVTAPSITAAVSSLERQGWVRRDPDPHDRRATLVCLTKQGHDVLADGEEQLRGFLIRLTSGLDHDALDALLKLEKPLHAEIDRAREYLGRDPEGIPRLW